MSLLTSHESITHNPLFGFWKMQQSFIEEVAIFKTHVGSDSYSMTNFYNWQLEEFFTIGCKMHLDFIITELQHGWGEDVHNRIREIELFIHVFFFSVKIHFARLEGVSNVWKWAQLYVNVPNL